MGCFSPSAPAPVNYGQQTAQTLQAQVAAAPALYAANANPNYGEQAQTTLSLGSLNELLNGKTAGTTTAPGTTSTTPAGYYNNTTGNLVSSDQGFYTGKNGGTQSGGNPGGSAPAGVTWRPATTTTTPGATTATPAVPGLNSLMAGANTAQRSADIGDVFNLGPQSTAATLNADPYNAALLTKLNAQANAGLDAGAGLTPEQTRDIQQSSIAADAERGTSADPASALSEVLNQFNAGNTLQTQRQQFAQSVEGGNQSIIGDPFQQILGRPSGATSTGVSMVPGNQFNPDDPLSANITAGNQQNAALFSTSGVQQIQNALSLPEGVAASY